MRRLCRPGGRRHAGLGRALVAATLAGSLVVAVGAPAQSPAQATLETLLGPLYQQLAALKAVTSPGPPPPVLVRSREESRRFVEQELDRRYSRPRLEAEGKAMAAWGLIPPGYDLRRLFVDLMEEQLAAYYDPRGKVLVVGDWLTPEQQQAALLHELVHALQDREIPLDRFLAPAPGQGDQLLARQALIEGEAVGVMLDLLLRAQGVDFASLPDMRAVRGLVGAGSTGPVIQQAPKFLRDLLLFSYVEGLTFVHEFRKRHPWQAMGALYRDPPRSTAQILHPDKRLVGREDPIPIGLPELGPLLPGLSPVSEDELGQFALGAVLALALGDAEGPRAAVGWRGDRYRVWEDQAGRFALVYLVAMESGPAARTLGQHLIRVLEGRHPELAGKGLPAPGPVITWQAGGHAFVVEQRGADALLVERVAAPAADRVREAVWRARREGRRP